MQKQHHNHHHHHPHNNTNNIDIQITKVIKTTSFKKDKSERKFKS